VLTDIRALADHFLIALPNINIGVMAPLSPRLRFWVKLPLLARDHHDMSLWKLALSATRFNPLVMARGALGEPASSDASASK
jgi:hypothetical protein